MIILTEKPNVAEAIANAIGGYTKKDGYFQKGSDCIVSAQGHLLELNEPEDYDSKFSKWTLEDLPICPDKLFYKPIAKNYKVLAKIKKCFEEFDSSEFILATDAEREGEVIGAEILNFLHFKNYENARRFWVSEALTKEVVLKGLENAKPLSFYSKYKNEGFARAQSDWLLGMNISRLLSVSTTTLLSFGRVQTAILGAIYLRDKSIENFTPVKYNQLEITCTKDNVPFTLLLEQNNSDRFAINSEYIQNALNAPLAQLKIIDLTVEQKTENPPQLFNITGLQKYCAAQFKINPDRTLAIAQKLYEEYKCLSYPRTPSTVLGDDNVALFKEKFELLSAKYPELAQGCLDSKIAESNKRIFDSSKLQDHHGLIPVDVIPEQAGDDEKHIYFSVVKRFFDLIKESFIYELTKIKAEADEFIFKSSGRKIIQEGFKHTFEESDDTENQQLPDLKIDDFCKISNKKLITKETKPKQHFTNSSILALMENPKSEDADSNTDGKLVGIGTPATRANIIKVLLQRGYIVQTGQKLLITEKGKFLINTVIKIPELKNLISISTTTEWEKKLSDNPDLFLSEMRQFILTKLKQFEITDKWIDKGIGECPCCHKGKIKEGDKSFFCSEYKAGCKFSVWKNIAGAKISVSDIQLLIAGKKTHKKKMTSSKTQKTFEASLQYINGKIDFIYDKKQ